MKISGIYEIKNKLDGKIYYGSSNDIGERYRGHKRELNKNKHSNPHLQNAWNKHGKENFICELCEKIEKEKLLDVEQKYLDICKLNPEKYYNISYNVYKNRLGMVVSESTREKLRLANKGKRLSEETKRKISESSKGRIVSEETRKKMSENNKCCWLGKKFSEEHKEKIRKNARKECGVIPSDESRKKMSESHKGIKNHNFGKPRSEETKQKIRLGNLGIKRSQETKDKISNLQKGKGLGKDNHFYGKTHSDESKLKISEASKNMWKLRKMSQVNL